MKLFWWQGSDGTHNLGDEITHLIFERVFGYSVTKSSYPVADVISTGSILGWAFEREDLRDRVKSMVVLGSGFMHPWAAIEERKWLDIRLVRGYLTKNLLSKNYSNNILVGDPGLLVSYFEVDDVEKKYKYGIIPHISSFDKIVAEDRFSMLGDVVYIDFRTDDFESILKQMKQCEIIISQGLHGLIFSDSLGIPNVWLDRGQLHNGGEFKFYDYFSSINRPFNKKIYGDVSEVKIHSNAFIADREVVESCQKNIFMVIKNYLSNNGS